MSYDGSSSQPAESWHAEPSREGSDVNRAGNERAHYAPSGRQGVRMSYIQSSRRSDERGFLDWAGNAARSMLGEAERRHERDIGEDNRGWGGFMPPSANGRGTPERERATAGSRAEALSVPTDGAEGANHLRPSKMRHGLGDKGAIGIAIATGLILLMILIAGVWLI